MIYIRQAHCISPQHSFGVIDMETLCLSQNNQLVVLEPAYEGIPRNTIRRMGKAVRMGVGAALPLLQSAGPVAGIIMGSANGGMEDSVSFLKQIIEYDEGMLTPGSFVQSTANAPASQLSLISGNKGYNITHVHRGLAFENAITDAALLLSENHDAQYIVGGLDEIASYNYELEFLDGWYKSGTLSNANLYSTNSTGSLAGEGSAVFLVSGRQENSLARLMGIRQFYGSDAAAIIPVLSEFLNEHGNPAIDLFLSGENGDSRFLPFYENAGSLMNPETTVARYKHLTGEYPTVSSFALWFSSQLLNGMPLPAHCVKKQGAAKKPATILAYNNHKNLQHSFMLLSK